MGLFGKFFKGKKADFTPTTEQMNENEFWQIIQSSFEDAGGDYEDQQEALRRILRKKTPQEIILYSNKFDYLFSEANDWQLWAAIYIIHGGCGDDSFIDFRSWLIAQGQDIYTKALADPESLIDVDSERFEVDWEGIQFVPAEIFEELTLEPLPAAFLDAQEMKGEEWSEEGDDLKNMFPRLWEKYH